jgi:PTS system glucitol/sorbitol-specific IIA component
VTEIGPLVSEFINADILVFFGEDTPEELREFSIIHNGKKLEKDIVPGDQIFIDDFSYKVLAVGNIANLNLGNLGHLIIKFNGLTEPKLPGDVCVEKKEIQPIKVGTVLKIVGDD